MAKTTKRDGRARRTATRRPSRRRLNATTARARRGGTPSVRVTAVTEIDALRRELERAARGAPPRWNADPDDVQRSVAHLVLTLVEFLRRLLERQAIRRFDAGTLSGEEAEHVGRALMNLEEAVREMATRFGLDPDDLNLDLGPVGKLI